MSLQTWNGSSYTVASTIKVWNGSSFVDAAGAKVWDGSAWKEFLYGNLTSAAYSVYYPGSKGSESRTDYWSGYSDGSGTGYFSSSFGSFSGQLLGCDVNVFAWSGSDWEISTDTGTWQVILTGNISTAKAIAINGTTITNSKTGTYSGGKTTWNWSSSSGDTVGYIAPNSPFINNGQYVVGLV